MLLNKFKQQAYLAYQGTSFSPEKRGEDSIKIYSEMLEDDLLKLKEANTFPESIEKYQKDFEDKFKHLLNCKAMCLSTMIVGPSNFPVKRAERANNREQKVYEDFMSWRDTWFSNTAKRIKREEIEAAGGELGMARNKLEELKNLQEKMKLINKAYSVFKKLGLPGLEKFNLSEEDIKTIIDWTPRYSFERVPYQRYSLTNNLAKIKNTEARISDLENKEFKANQGENIKVDIPDGYLLMNYEADRIQIFNNEKPSSEIISSYKKHGLKWSPFNKCWQRQITNNAKYSMYLLFNIKL